MSRLLSDSSAEAMGAANSTGLPFIQAEIVHCGKRSIEPGSRLER